MMKIYGFSKDFLDHFLIGVLVAFRDVAFVDLIEIYFFCRQFFGQIFVNWLRC